MRTSITRISSRPDRVAGFTFLELLVVVRSEGVRFRLLDDSQQMTLPLYEVLLPN